MERTKSVIEYIIDRCPSHLSRQRLNQVILSLLGLDEDHSPLRTYVMELVSRILNDDEKGDRLSELLSKLSSLTLSKISRVLSSILSRIRSRVCSGVVSSESPSESESSSSSSSTEARVVFTESRISGVSILVPSNMMGSGSEDENPTAREISGSKNKGPPPPVYTDLSGNERNQASPPREEFPKRMSWAGDLGKDYSKRAMTEMVSRMKKEEERIESEERWAQTFLPGSYLVGRVRGWISDDDEWEEEEERYREKLYWIEKNSERNFPVYEDEYYPEEDWDSESDIEVEIVL